ncbi:hypothetical protein N9L11_02105 [Euryarchaeota archaeon]|nr:hypothetical protein [Euryarchaeota archaeon]
MVGTPLDVLPYVRGIQMVLSGYEGYTKGKRRAADLAIREEIQRCGTRARNHLLNVHDNAFREKKIDIAKAAKACCNSIDQLIEDVDKSPTGMSHAFFSGQNSASISVLSTTPDLVGILGREHLKADLWGHGRWNLRHFLTDESWGSKTTSQTRS